MAKKVVTVVLISFIVVKGVLGYLGGDYYQKARLLDAEKSLCHDKKRSHLSPHDTEGFIVLYSCTDRKRFSLDKTIELPVASFDLLCEEGKVMTYRDQVFTCSPELFPSGRIKFFP